MLDKLNMSKGEIENAQGYINQLQKSIEKLKEEKKAQKQKIKVKNSVVMQQEQ
jgi:hypothetical protein